MLDVRGICAQANAEGAFPSFGRARSSHGGGAGHRLLAWQAAPVARLVDGPVRGAGVFARDDAAQHRPRRRLCAQFAPVAPGCDHPVAAVGPRAAAAALGVRGAILGVGLVDAAQEDHRQHRHAQDVGGPGAVPVRGKPQLLHAWVGLQIGRPCLEEPLRAVHVALSPRSLRWCSTGRATPNATDCHHVHLPPNLATHVDTGLMGLCRAADERSRCLPAEL